MNSREEKVENVAETMDEVNNMKSSREITIDLVDHCVNRIESLRQIAFQLEEERNNLIFTLNSLLNECPKRFPSSDQKEISQQISNLIDQCQTVEISVEIPRNESQINALFNINHQIDKLLEVHKENQQLAVQKCHSFINACVTPYSVDVIDRFFENMLLDCTIDDQHRIHRRLIGLLNYFTSHF